ncbi:hypothetical protein ACQPW1_40575 [Nocardia sp. CA-128927]|uniref:hypothetical protein n=1 Tax=Nocardia sp. CA-128927 TaxID=3239975 RepID=UPI003D98290F
MSWVLNDPYFVFIPRIAEMTYEPAVWAAVVMGAVTVYRMRWWRGFPESRLFTMAFGAISSAYILAVSPVVEGLNQISINVTGNAIALLASVLLATLSFSSLATVALEILTGSRHSGRYVGTVWAMGAVVMIACWFTGDARHSKTLNSFTALDVSARVFAITYVVLSIATGLVTLVATWQVLQRKGLRPKLRRAAAGLSVTAACLIGLAATLLFNALVLDLSSGSAQIIEQIWWVPITIALTVAGL